LGQADKRPRSERVSVLLDFQRAPRRRIIDQDGTTTGEVLQPAFLFHVFDVVCVYNPRGPCARRTQHEKTLINELINHN